MELPQIVELMKEPEKLINPQVIVNLRMDLAGIIDDLKLEIFELKLQVSQKLVEIRKTTTSATMAKAELEQTEIWRLYNEKVRLKERLNGFRADLKDKLFLITGQKF